MRDSFHIRLFSGLAALAVASLTTPAYATYWSLFNIEGENTASSVYVTYSTLDDMLNDANRLSFALPDGFGAGRNVVGTGSDVFVSGGGGGGNVPEPATVTLFSLRIAGIGYLRRRKSKA